MANSIKTRAETISMRQLKLFESVGRLHNVRRGSVECNLSQPAVTQALRKLEEQVGCRLLERRASGSYLTLPGQIMHKRVTRMFSLLEEALQELDRQQSREAAQAVVNRLSRSQIRSLIAMIEHGSFKTASLALGLSDAALKRATRDLESNLGTQIYVRTAAGLMVTHAGLRFGRRVRLALQEVAWGLDEIGNPAAGVDGRIVVGTLPFGGNMLLTSVLEDFLARHPAVDLQIVSCGASEMMTRLRDGSVDLVIGLIQETPGEDVSHQLLTETPYAIVARRNHPLTRLQAIDLASLAGFDWVVGAEGSNRRACFDALFAGHPRPATPITTSATTVIRHLLSGSDRLTLMTSYELSHHDQALVRLPFAPITPAPTLGITHRSDWMPTPLHEDFTAMLRARVMLSTLPQRLHRAG
jgi:DNA-binding transcriptional LysR family regulator